MIRTGCSALSSLAEARPTRFVLSRVPNQNKRGKRDERTQLACAHATPWSAPSEKDQSQRRCEGRGGVRPPGPAFTRPDGVWGPGRRNPAGGKVEGVGVDARVLAVREQLCAVADYLWSSGSGVPTPASSLSFLERARAEEGNRRFPSRVWDEVKAGIRTGQESRRRCDLSEYRRYIRTLLFSVYSL